MPSHDRSSSTASSDSRVDRAWSVSSTLRQHKASALASGPRPARLCAAPAPGRAPQNHLASSVLRVQVVEQGGAGAADVQVAGRRRRKPHADLRGRSGAASTRRVQPRQACRRTGKLTSVPREGAAFCAVGDSAVAAAQTGARLRAALGSVTPVSSTTLRAQHASGKHSSREAHKSVSGDAGRLCTGARQPRVRPWGKQRWTAVWKHPAVTHPPRLQRMGAARRPQQVHSRQACHRLHQCCS